MAAHFKIAQDQSFTVDVTEFYQDPVGGDYAPYEWPRRGSILPCLSGVQVQDFGLDMQDRKIIIRDDNAFKQTHVDALQAKYATADTDWYFTDGVHVFKVRFWEFRYWTNVKHWLQGLQLAQPPASKWVWYSYEITLLVREVIS